MKISRFDYEAQADATSPLGSLKDLRLGWTPVSDLSEPDSVIQQMAAKENFRDRVSGHSLV
jgi:hypothetical protein